MTALWTIDDMAKAMGAEKSGVLPNAAVVVKPHAHLGDARFVQAGRERQVSTRIDRRARGEQVGLVGANDEIDGLVRFVRSRTDASGPAQE